MSRASLRRHAVRTHARRMRSGGHTRVDQHTRTNRAGAGKKITILNIPEKGYTRGGVHYPRPGMIGHHAIIEPGKCITLIGEEKVGSRYVWKVTDLTEPHGPKQLGSNDKPIVYRKKFCIGDTAIYHSYNFDYDGTITAIGEKTVSIVDHGRTHKLSIAQFSSHNHDYSKERVAERFASWSD